MSRPYYRYMLLSTLVTQVLFLFFLSIFTLTLRVITHHSTYLGLCYFLTITNVRFTFYIWYFCAIVCTFLPYLVETYVGSPRCVSRSVLLHIMLRIRVLLFALFITVFELVNFAISCNSIWIACLYPVLHHFSYGMRAYILIVTKLLSKKIGRASCRERV